MAQYFYTKGNQLDIKEITMNEVEYPFNNLFKRHYSKYIFKILLNIPKEEWILGSEICKKFDELCSNGLILDTNGLLCKEFAYDYLFNELIGYNKGQVIECFSSFPRVRSNISPA